MMQVSVSSDSGDFHISGSICSLILIQVNSLDQSVSHLDVFRGPWTLTGFRKISYGPVLSRHWIIDISVMLAVSTSLWQQMGTQQLSLVQSVNPLTVYVLSGTLSPLKRKFKVTRLKVWIYIFLFSLFFFCLHKLLVNYLLY
jgi:hypothetical protein